MARSRWIILTFSICFFACDDRPQHSPPNILLILADDLGYTDLGCYGSEIRTPNIDKLAQNGIRFTSLCTAPTCSPTRGMLLTGTVSQKNGFGTMAGDWSDNQKGQKGYEGYLNFDVVSFPKLLRDAGYHTSIAGKWHLAFPPKKQEQWPMNRGFTRSFCLLQGGGGHFADKQPMLKQMGEALYVQDNALVGELPKNFYSSAYYADKAIEYIRESQKQEKPFFHFLSFTAPHWPLQVPDSVLHAYKGNYDEGYEYLAKKRLAKAKEQGIIPRNTRLPTLSPNVKPWHELTEVEKQLERRSMEIYAAMIEEVDTHTGRVIDYLEKIGELENTWVLFMADNGAEGNSIMGYDGTGEWVAENFDNSLENMGRPNSYVELGTGWAQVSSLPFKWYKAFATEGGVRVPAIFHYPEITKERGSIHHDFLSVMDLAPSFLDLAGVDHPGNMFQGRMIYRMDGQTMLPWLMGEKERVHNPAQAHAWELFGRRGVRKGKWKAEWMEAPYGNNQWELYNLNMDLAQQNNVAKEYPGKLAELIEDFEVFVKSNQVILPDRPTAYAKESYWRE